MTANRTTRNAERDRARASKHPATAAQEKANEAALATKDPEPVRENGTRAVYGTWKFHDSPADFQYMGRHNKIPADPIHVHARTNANGQQITLVADDKTQVGQFGVATKFWIGIDGQTEHASDLRKAAKAEKQSTPKQLHPCRCGCGKQVKNLYAQGHDARHVSQLAEKYRDLVAADLPQSEFNDKAADLFKPIEDRPRLVSKLERSMELIDAKAAKRDKAAADKSESEGTEDE